MEEAKKTEHWMLSFSVTPGAIGAAPWAEFLDEDVCRDWILRRVYPTGPRCPRCLSAITEPAVVQTFWAARRFRCPTCRAHITALTGTVLAGSHRSFRETILLGILIHLEVRPKVIAAALGESEETIRAWMKKFDNLAAGGLT